LHFSLYQHGAADSCKLQRGSALAGLSLSRLDVWGGHGTVRVFRQKITLEDAIGSHACSLKASMRVTNGMPLRRQLPLTFTTVNPVQTPKATGVPIAGQQLVERDDATATPTRWNQGALDVHGPYGAPLAPNTLLPNEGKVLFHSEFGELSLPQFETMVTVLPDPSMWSVYSDAQAERSPNGAGARHVKFIVETLARCAFFRDLHARMPLVSTHARLKLLHVRDQWHSSRVFTPFTG
jgi:hypothetical protein